jgi:predicted nucleic acid-binding protein
VTLAFPDTNVLLYAFSTDAKRDRARAIVEGGGIISVQSLNEFAHVARRKLGFGWPEVREAIAALLAYFPHVVSLDVELQRDALRLAERHMLSIYDAQIVAAALAAGCDRLYSEDMHHGLVVEGGLRIENPFLG